MRTESACAGEVRTTVDAAEHTAATVSAARRADDLLGKGSLRGRDRAPGRGRDRDGSRVDPSRSTVVRGALRCGGVASGRPVPVRRGGHRVRWTRVEPSEQLSPDFYARQSPAWPGQLSRFQPCAVADREMNRAAWVEIRLG
ncbi:hypothetical protein GCM10020256_60090 [Streptomyces thermocoprophilus]